MIFPRASRAEGNTGAPRSPNVVMYTNTQPHTHNTHTLTHSLTHSLTHTITHSLTHKITNSHIRARAHTHMCVCVYRHTHSLTHSLTHSHSQTHTLAHTHTHTHTHTHMCVCVYRLETALRKAFAQEQALCKAHADNESKWTESSAGLRDTISKQARLLSLRQV
jgi:hypothetical protein